MCFRITALGFLACTLLLQLLLAQGGEADDLFYQPFRVAADGGAEAARKMPTFVHAAEKGETLFHIAERFLHDPYKARILEQLNDVSDPLRLREGQKILVPRPQMALKYEVQKLQDNKDLKLVGSQERFQAGDRFQVRLSANMDGYLYVANREANGDVHLLFPGPKRKAPRIRRYSEYLMPPDGWYRFDEDDGDEELWVLVAAEPLPEIDRAVADRDRKVRSASAFEPYFAESSKHKGIEVVRAEEESRGIVTVSPGSDVLILAHRIVLRRR